MSSLTQPSDGSEPARPHPPKASSLRIGSHMGSQAATHCHHKMSFRVKLSGWGQLALYTIQSEIMAVFRQAKQPLSLWLRACISEPAHGLCPGLHPVTCLLSRNYQKCFPTFNSDSSIVTDLPTLYHAPEIKLTIWSGKSFRARFIGNI